MKERILYVDMDDTICHYTKHYNRMLEKNPAIKYPQSQYGFYLDIPPIEEALHYLNKLQSHYTIYILSRPSVKNVLCYTEKRVWLEKNLGIQYAENLILCPDKSLLIGDFLVDDVLWPKFRGDQLQFGSEDFPKWVHVYNYLMRVVLLPVTL